MKANTMVNGELLRPEPKKRYMIKTKDKNNTIVLTNKAKTVNEALDRGYSVYDTESGQHLDITNKLNEE